jgi:hypothetical protein
MSRRHEGKWPRSEAKPRRLQVQPVRDRQQVVGGNESLLLGVPRTTSVGHLYAPRPLVRSTCGRFLLSGHHPACHTVARMKGESSRHRSRRCVSLRQTGLRSHAIVMTPPANSPKPVTIATDHAPVHRIILRRGCSGTRPSPANSALDLVLVSPAIPTRYAAPRSPRGTQRRQGARRPPSSAPSRLRHRGGTYPMRPGRRSPR